MELADTSAWTNRQKDRGVFADFEARVVAREIATTQPVTMEMLWNARSADFSARRVELGFLPQVPVVSRTWERALDVWYALVRRGRHRQIPHFDLLIAAAAELADLPVLHYDRHFELIAEVTGQPTRLIAPLGSL